MTLSPLAGRHLRIAFVVHDYTRCIGHSRYVVELATRFRTAHDVTVFAHTFDEPPESITFCKIPAIRTNALVSVISFIAPATLLVRGRFDIIHSQGLCGFRHNIATAHICQSAWYDALSGQSLVLTWRQKVFKWLVAGLERRALCRSGTKRVIAISERIKSDLARYYGRSDGVPVIYHGVDTTTFNPANRDKYRTECRAALGVPKDRFLALYVGDLKKGAAAAIRATARTEGVTLLIVSGSRSASHKELAKAEGISDRVIFTPYSKRVEVVFAAADVLIFPTVYDTFGLVITEAMASGLPVITSRAAGAAELITDGIDGLITANPWDVSALASHLGRLRDDPKLRDGIGAAARAKVEPFTWERVAEQTMAVYHEVLAGIP